MKNFFAKKDSRKKWLLIAAVIMSVFLDVATPQAVAAQNATEPTQLLNNGLLGIIQGAITALNGFMQGIQLAMFKTGFSSMVAAQNGTAMEISDSVGKGAQFIADTRKLDSMTAIAAKYQGDATMPDQSTAMACAMIGATIQHEASRAAAKGGSLAFQRLDAAQYTGANAGSGLDLQALMVKNLCKLGFIQQSEGIAQKLNCTADSNFTDADMVAGYVCQDELLVPGGVTQAGNQYLDFSNIQTGSGDKDCGKNGKCFAAAFLFCQHRSRAFAIPKPSNNAKLQAGDITAFLTNRAQSTNRVSDDNDCFSRIRDRMKCDGNSSIQASSAVGGGSDNCNQAQMKECHLLYDPPPQGMGIQTDALKDCIGGAGMSLYMLRKTRTMYACNNANTASQLNPASTDWNGVKQSVDKCSNETAEQFDESDQQCEQSLQKPNSNYEGYESSFSNPDRGSSGN